MASTFLRKSPDRLREISERVYVFDSCLKTDVLDDVEYRYYIEDIVTQLQDYYPDASFMAFNFQEGGRSQSLLADLLSRHDITVLAYPWQYEGCPLLPMEMISHALRLGQSWLSVKGQHNILLMHCERGGWAVLAFICAALLLYQRTFTGEQRTLEMVYKEAPRELIQLLSPLNPMPSQMRYLRYISRRDVSSEWPPGARPFVLDCVVLKRIAGFKGEDGCRLLFRVHGKDPLLVGNDIPKVFSSTPKEIHKEEDCELIKINIDCRIQGDVVLECVSTDAVEVREEILFRVMFNTAFIRSNILVLNRYDIDKKWNDPYFYPQGLWNNAKDRFPKKFRAEVIVSEVEVMFGSKKSSQSSQKPLGLSFLGSSIPPPPPLPPGYARRFSPVMSSAKPWHPPPLPPGYTRRFSPVMSSAKPWHPPPPPAPAAGYCSGFYCKPPDGLLEISDRVFVFNSCFSTNAFDDDTHRQYFEDILTQLHDYYPDASFMVFNFQDGEEWSLFSDMLSTYDITVMDYPREYEGCPLLTMETISHALRSGEHWLNSRTNILLLHCEQGGWPVLAFMTAALLLYRKIFVGEDNTLDMVYKQAPRDLARLPLSPLNSIPSQRRYLHHISQRNVSSEWPPVDRLVNFDCVILRSISGFNGEDGCRLVFRIHGKDPLLVRNYTPKVFFSTPKKYYKRADYEFIKINIDCQIQGDVVLECISVGADQVREEMMFRVMFSTAFIKSNIMVLNRDEIDMMWDAKNRFQKEFRAEIIFSEIDTADRLDPIEDPKSKNLSPSAQKHSGLSPLLHSSPAPPPSVPGFSPVISSVQTSPTPPLRAPAAGNCSRVSPMGSNRSTEPASLTIGELRKMTDNFSKERVLGQGAYGKVFKGVHANGEEIAVKLLHNNIQGIDDGQFKQEFHNLMMLNHHNIVRLVGYCFETQHQHMVHEGEIIFCEMTYKALCFEYMQRGSLQKHIHDEAHELDWDTCYKIIKGICDGLYYLHEGCEKPIYHLDLKPDNILLNEHMLPKLADFGLSKFFGEEQTRVTQFPLGTLGYMPPEYLFQNIVSKKVDIFSLGVVMIKIIAGPKGHSRSAEMPRKEFLDLVQENWRNRLQTTSTPSQPLEALCQKVNICTKIALRCMDTDRHKRPTIVHIIDKLNGTETVIDKALS